METDSYARNVCGQVRIDCAPALEKAFLIPKADSSTVRSMARIEKRYDKRGNLKWAKGAARDIYKDEEILNSHGVYFRLSGEQSRWFNTMIPRHMASWETEGPPSSERLGELYSNLPPFEQWRFALIGYEGPKQSYICLAQEIDGEKLIEVKISRRSRP